jgi:histidinol-phosphate/aromatic aminotransferase/cobyric acid decarboxylase-like protein
MRSESTVGAERHVLSPPGEESSMPERSPCFHGGSFFAAIGDEFDDLSRRRRVVNADVLDAPFPPSPRVRAALRADLAWLMRTSPPVHGEGLRRVVAEMRGLPEESIALGAGSSDLIFRAFTRWLTRRSRVLVPDPTYGEYAHVAGQVVGASLERFELSPRDGFALDLDALARRVRDGRFDLVVVVNPNNPTGGVVPREPLERFLAGLPRRTIAWVDEAYVEYAGPGLSVERAAASSRRVVVCKSLSKGFALSGMRVAYLVGPPPLAAELRHATPPWCVGLPAQVAAVAALKSEAWYARRRARVHQWRASLRRALASSLAGRGVRVEDSCANWLLCFLPAPLRAAELVERCRREGVFLRDAGATSPVLGRGVVRVAVRTPAENRRIVAAVAAAVDSMREAATAARGRHVDPIAVPAGG